MEPYADSVLIYGTHSVIETIQAGKQIDRILIQEGISNELSGRMMSLAKTHSIPVAYVPQARIDALVKGRNHQGVIAYVAPVTFHSLEEVVSTIVAKGETPLLVLADKITDVRNLGSIVRTMECMGGHALIIPFNGSARINAEAIKASAGALLHVPICRERNLKDAVHFLKESGIRIIACQEKSGTLIMQEDLSGPLCLVIGSESEGISSALLSSADAEVYIPMQGKIESLNVSVATGMALYEIMSQRRISG